MIKATGSFFKQKQRAASNYQHEVIFAVKQNNIPSLEAFLLEVSDPDHPTYGQYKTREEVGCRGVRQSYQVQQTTSE